MAMTINNVAYSWSMIRFDLSGLNVSFSFSGATALKWNIKRNVKVNHGLGGNPVSRGFGNIEYTASITLDYSTILALRDVAKGPLTALGEFDLTISFANTNAIDGADAGNIVQSHTIELKQCFFSEDGFESETDDSNITKEFDLNPFEIKVS